MNDARLKVVAMDPEDNVTPEAGEGFVATPYVKELTERVLSYLGAGYPVHFAGPAGTGKTTLAFHVAAQLDQPVTLIHGDDEFSSADLVGRDSGYRKSRVVDNYIHSVLKTEEHYNTTWEDNRLTTACQKGYTLIYDEFTRSRPEANNALLSVLEEKILNLPKLRRSGNGYIAVHPSFRAIFTSNPEEYAGVHKTQDALLDRLITIHVSHFDRSSEIQIAGAKSGLPRPDCEIIVDIIREMRQIGVNNNRPTIRACIAIAKILSRAGGRASTGNRVFMNTCRDILAIDTAKVTRGGQSLMVNRIDEIVKTVCEKHQTAQKSR
jgi:gas vesicle protein GvpN